MSDDISIPRSSMSGAGSARTSFTHSYRSRRTGMDSGTKRLLLAASALGIVLVGGMAIWTFKGHQVTGVPTFTADSRPMRIKPSDPGGMAAIGVVEQALATSDATSDLAPAAEQPDPQALLAQRQQAPAPKIATTPVPAPPAAGVAPAAPVAAAPVLPATPMAAPAPDVTTRREVARPVAGPMVQLAALDTEAAASTEWQRLAHKEPDLFGARKPVVQRTEQNGRAFWRLRTGGFADLADATEFCKRLRAKGMGCSLANF